MRFTLQFFSIDNINNILRYHQINYTALQNKKLFRQNINGVLIYTVSGRYTKNKTLANNVLLILNYSTGYIKFQNDVQMHIYDICYNLFQFQKL